MIGCKVVEANDGVEALRCIDQIAPDLIICDLMMPEISGPELLRELHAHPETESIPFIVLSALSSDEDKIQAFDLGADDYVTKPYSFKELQARVRAKIRRPPVPARRLRQDRLTGVLSHHAFLDEIAREQVRQAGDDEAGYAVCVGLSEIEMTEARLGISISAPIIKQLIALVTFDSLPVEVIGRDAEHNILLLLPDTGHDTLLERLEALTRRVAAHTFVIGDELVRMTPVIGYTRVAGETGAAQIYEQTVAARTYAALHLDLTPSAYEPHMDKLLQAVKAKTQTMNQVSLWSRLTRHWRTAFQISTTVFLGIILPFLVYFFLGTVGYDITPLVYIAVVIALLATAILIWAESLLALRRIDPPALADPQYPPASAIIAAYLPNESATIEATIQAFLRLEYPGLLQIILAYNTPRDMPIERLFQQIAAQDTRFLPLRIKGSTSKAQNVNAALAHVTGKFVGVFDADHHPDPGSFQRAWGWLAAGYDIVQGHCLIRNGDSSWVARTIAVEFESIYALAHPGRARLHGYGIFGGSNGFWKTDLLRQTRMHGFMLTEDIDSSFRVMEQGYKIASDPYLISRELAPTRLYALWNQRMRWAQGWFQVALKQTLPLLRSSKLTRRQKAGVFHLLVWREIYPWLSTQVIPIVLYWAWQAGGLHRIDWFVPIFVITSIVTIGTGPGQVLLIYRQADAAIRAHRGWFWGYVLISILFYTEFKNTVGRVAQIKEVMGERVWKSTPRV